MAVDFCRLAVRTQCCDWITLQLSTLYELCMAHDAIAITIIWPGPAYTLNYLPLPSPLVYHLLLPYLNVASVVSPRNSFICSQAGYYKPRAGNYQPRRPQENHSKGSSGRVGGKPKKHFHLFSSRKLLTPGRKLLTSTPTGKSQQRPFGSRRG